MKTKVTLYDLEINLDDIFFNDLVKYVQDSSDSTLVDNNRLRFIDNWEEDFTELIECFEKHSINKIRRQQIIQNIIDQLDAGQTKKV